MKKTFISAVIFISAHSLSAQFDLDKVIKDVKSETSKIIPSKGLSNDEVINGLKEALSVGSNNSSSAASKADGFYKNPKIKIPFPQEAIDMKTTLDKLGMKKQTDKFIETLNRGAESAAKEAAPIFLDAIKGMSIGDGFAILNGQDTAATSYLKGKTTTQLDAAFKPKVKEALQKVELTKYWKPLMTKYNRIPGVTKQNPDLDSYVTAKAMEGLFTLLADEEIKIRKDPAAQVSDLLKKVFGSKK